MEFKDDEARANWAIGRENNQDDYGRAVFDFAEQWAEAMEEEIAGGAHVKDIAERLNRKIDDKPGFGITGFMYGCVVKYLSMAWKWGEDLRKWHNGEYNYDGPGTVNPAILSIFVPE